MLIQISFLILSIPLHPCQVGPPLSTLSSRPERSVVEGPAVSSLSLRSDDSLKVTALQFVIRSDGNKWVGNRAHLVTKKFWTRPKNRTNVEVSIHTSAPSCHDGPAWPCTGALYPCICREPPGKASAPVGMIPGCSKQQCDI
jgi:hypothetical protein